MAELQLLWEDKVGHHDDDDDDDDDDGDDDVDDDEDLVGQQYPSIFGKVAVVLGG